MCNGQDESEKKPHIIETISQTVGWVKNKLSSRYSSASKSNHTDLDESEDSIDVNIVQNFGKKDNLENLQKERSFKSGISFEENIFNMSSPPKNDHKKEIVVGDSNSTIDESMLDYLEE